MAVISLNNPVTRFEQRMPDLILGSNWEAILDAEHLAGWVLWTYARDVGAALEFAKTAYCRASSVRLAKWKQVIEILEII